MVKREGAWKASYARERGGSEGARASGRHSNDPAARRRGLLVRAGFAYTRAVVHAETFALLGITLHVTSDDPAALAWLIENLTPAFERVSGTTGDFHVDVATAPDRYGELVATRPAGLVASVPCFTRDQKLTYRPAWEHGGRTIVDEHRLGAFYVTSDLTVDVVRDRRVDVLAASGTSRVRTAAMRVIREIAVSSALGDAGAAVLHAAGVGTSSGAVLLAGPRETGKTTMLAALAHALGAAVLANDRTLVRRDAGGWKAHGIPTIVNVRPGTLTLLPELAAAVARVRSSPDLTVAEATAARSLPLGSSPDSRTKLSPAQLAAALGAGRAGRCRVAAVLFPDPHPGAREITITRLSPHEATRGIATARFGFHADANVPTVFARLAGARRPAGADEAVLARLAAEIPCFAIRIDPAALADPTARDRLVTDLGLRA